MCFYEDVFELCNKKISNYALTGRGEMGFYFHGSQ